jgi:hypothetical protein
MYLAKLGRNGEALHVLFFQARMTYTFIYMCCPAAVAGETLESMVLFLK